ncbi:hypothetical protein D3C71_1701520 [compost metagenome]
MVANGFYLVIVFRIQTKFFKIVFMERFFDDKRIASKFKIIQSLLIVGTLCTDKS